MAQYDVITFGDMCVDLIVSGGDIVPRFGQAEQLVDDYALEMGGSGCIFACQAARLGLRAAVLGRVGDDAFGRLIMARLAACGVDTRHVAVDPALKTGLGIALCAAEDRAILTYLGSISALRPADVPDALLASARHLHYGSYYLHTGLRPHAVAILERARALGLTTSLDTNWDPEERWTGVVGEALPLIDLFLPNEREALHISGAATLDEAAARFCADGARLVAIKRGAQGARLYAEGGILECAVTPARRADSGVADNGAADSVGAGDSFDAGFLAAWLRDLPLGRCLAVACACGTAVAGAVGGLAGQLTWTEVAHIVDHQARD
ncbi:MAG: sugar kinase [Anaerolineae bacterium]|nr:sugar kinase [Anaerolineae bacterium]